MVRASLNISARVAKISIYYCEYYNGCIVQHKIVYVGLEWIMCYYEILKLVSNNLK